MTHEPILRIILSLLPRNILNNISNVIISSLVIFLIVQTHVNAQEVLASVESMRLQLTDVKKGVDDLRVSFNVLVIAQAQRDNDQDEKIKELTENDKKQDEKIKELERQKKQAEEKKKNTNQPN